MVFIINQIFDDMHPPEAATWCNENGKAYIAELAPVDGMRRFQIVAVPEPTFEEQIEAAYADFDTRVEARLNAFAATRRYSSINSACSYSTSTDPQFRLEGEYCVQARDATYRKCYDLLAEYMPDVLAGKRPIPTWEEIEAQLPPLVWPDEQVVEEPALDSTTA
jgi:hypothetical protein